MSIESDKSKTRANLALSRFQSVDHLMVRPKLPSIDQMLETTGQTVVAKRISLLAFQELEQRIKNAPAEPQPYLDLAEIYKQQGRFKDMMRVLNSGVQNNPEFEPLIIFREEAILRASEQSMRDAVLLYEKDPTEETRAHLDRSQVSFANEQITFCHSRYSRHPEQTGLLIPWAAALRALSRYDEAIQLLSTAVEMPPLRSTAALELGECYLELQKPVEAFSALRKAALFRSPPPSHEVRQRALRRAYEAAERLNMVDAAKRYLTLLLEQECPDRPDLVRRLELLSRRMS